MSRISGLIEAVKARIEREGANINNVTASLAALDSTVAPECCKRIYLKHIANQPSAEAKKELWVSMETQSEQLSLAL